MRAWDIAVLLICFNLAIGLVGSMGIFTHMYYTPVQQNVMDANDYMRGDINSTKDLINNQKQSNADYFSLGMMIFGAWNLFISILLSALCVAPQLLAFGMPLPLVLVIQSLIYLIDIWGIIQFMSGRSGSLMQ
jgi:hypothetical protein